MSWAIHGKSGSPGIFRVSHQSIRAGSAGGAEIPTTRFEEWGGDGNTGASGE